MHQRGSDLRAGLSQWIGYYNARRPHSALDGRTPDEAYGVMATERLATRIYRQLPGWILPPLVNRAVGAH
jgi:Integrase core domain